MLMCIECLKMLLVQGKLFFYHEASFFSGASDIFVSKKIFQPVLQYLASLRMVLICGKKEMQHATQCTHQVQPFFGCTFCVQGVKKNHYHVFVKY